MNQKTNFKEEHLYEEKESTFSYSKKQEQHYGACLKSQHQKNENVVGIIKIQDDCVFLSLKKTQFHQPDCTIVDYNIAKILYPNFVSERLLYQKFQYVSLIDDVSQQQQGCVFDVNTTACLVKWLPSELFSWIDYKNTDPLLLLEYLETLTLEPNTQ